MSWSRRDFMQLAGRAAQVLAVGAACPGIIPAVVAADGAVRVTHPVRPRRLTVQVDWRSDLGYQKQVYWQYTDEERCVELVWLRDPTVSDAELVRQTAPWVARALQRRR